MGFDRWMMRWVFLFFEFRNFGKCVGFFEFCFSCGVLFVCGVVNGNNSNFVNFLSFLGCGLVALWDE